MTRGELGLQESSSSWGGGMKCGGSSASSRSREALPWHQRKRSHHRHDADARMSDGSTTAPSEREESGSEDELTPLESDCDDRCSADPPWLRHSILKRSKWESIQVDPAAEIPAQCLVVPPTGRKALQAPAPVLLFLSGNGHVDDRQDFLWGGLDLLLRNRDLRRRFFIIAPKPLTRSGMLRENDNWCWTWSEDAVWAVLTEVLRRLGPRRVDPSRLCATGLSLGAIGVWNLSLKYGQHLAAVAPVSGRCEWPGNTWPKGQEGPRPDVLARLKSVAIRAYHIDIDHRAGHPEGDFKHLCWAFDAEETAKTLHLRGVERGTRVKVNCRVWTEKSAAAGEATQPSWELWQAAGPLQDWSYFEDWGGDNHCLWQRVYPYTSWGLCDFFEKHRVPKDQQWRFDEAPLCLRTIKTEEESWAAICCRKRRCDETEEANALGYEDSRYEKQADKQSRKRPLRAE